MKQEFPTAEPAPPAATTIFDGTFTLGGVKFDRKLTTLIILGTLLPMIDWYHRFFAEKAYDRLILYLLMPLLILIVGFRERPADNGFQIGNWREGLKWVAVVTLVLFPVLAMVANLPGVQRYYVGKVGDNGIWLQVYINAIDLFGWEFIWRGFMLFGVARILGPGPAIFIQAVPFAFMHLRKPEIETLTTIFGGAGFGLIAWRTRSFIYPWLIHWFIANITMMAAIGVF